MGTEKYSDTRIHQHTGKKVFVLRGAMYGACVALMAEMGFIAAASVEQADLVVFIGGTDVNPNLYHEKPILGVSGFDTSRDVYEEAIFRKCVKLDIPMFGICRGAQFLHVMNKGTLWQDVNNHAGSPHWIVDINSDKKLLATSLHHQMLQLNDRIEIIAVCDESIATKLKSENLFIDLDREGANAEPELEIEAGAYPSTKCIFVQGHPEIGTLEYKSWTSLQLRRFLDKPVSSDLQEQVETIKQKTKEGA